MWVKAERGCHGAVAKQVSSAKADSGCSPSVYPALPSVCENVLSPRWGYEFTPLCTPDLRPGLHSGAAPRLKNDGIVPPRFRFPRSHTDSAVLGFTMTPLKGAGVRRSGTGSTVQNFTGLHWVLQDLRAGVYDATATRLMRCWLHLHHSSQNFVTGSHCVGYVLMPLRGYFACCPVLQSSCETPLKAAALKQVF